MDNMDIPEARTRMFSPVLNRVFPPASVMLMALALLFTAPAAAHEASPLELVRDTSSRMLVAMKDNGAAIAADPAVLDKLVEEIVLPYFDFRRMSQWVLGKYWRKAAPDERERFVVEFRNLLVRTYARFLFDYVGEKVIYLPVGQASDATNVTVRTEIELSDSAAVPVAYSLYLGPDGWKVYDVAFEGVSMVTNYRSSYGRIIRAQGMTSLIDQMVQRNMVQAGG